MENPPDQLTNGLSSLQENNVDSQLSWACSLKSIADIILVWHVATSFCALDRKYGCNEEESGGVCLSRCCAPLLGCCESKGEESAAVKAKRRREVAERLSKYCVYLVAFVAALLPDPTDATEVILDKAIMDARKLLGKCRDLGDVYHELRKVEEKLNEEEESKALGKKKKAQGGEQIVDVGGFGEKVIVVEKGAKLGIQLLLAVENDQTRLWKVLIDLC